jgi:hypothetical protein
MKVLASIFALLFLLKVPSYGEKESFHIYELEVSKVRAGSSLQKLFFEAYETYLSYTKRKNREIINNARDYYNFWRKEDARIDGYYFKVISAIDIKGYEKGTLYLAKNWIYDGRGDSDILFDRSKNCILEFKTPMDIRPFSELFALTTFTGKTYSNSVGETYRIRNVDLFGDAVLNLVVGKRMKEVEVLPLHDRKEFLSQLKSGNEFEAYSEDKINQKCSFCNGFGSKREKFTYKGKIKIRTVQCEGCEGKRDFSGRKLFRIKW